MYSVPGVVSNLKAINVTVSSVILTWSPSQTPNGRIVGYNIQYELYGILFENNTKLRKFKIRNVLAGTELNYVKVSAINDVGTGAPVYLNKKLKFQQAIGKCAGFVK